MIYKLFVALVVVLTGLLALPPTTDACDSAAGDCCEHSAEGCPSSTEGGSHSHGEMPVLVSDEEGVNPHGGMKLPTSGKGAMDPHAGMSTSASGDDGTITVTALKDGKPVEGVTVRLVKFVRVERSIAGEKVTGPDGIARFEKIQYGLPVSFKLQYAYKGIEFPRVPQHLVVDVSDYKLAVSVDTTSDPNAVSLLQREMIISGHVREDTNWVRVVEYYTLGTKAYYLAAPGGQPIVLGSVPAGAVDARYWSGGMEKGPEVRDAKVVASVTKMAPGTMHKFGVTYLMEFVDGKAVIEADSVRDTESCGRVCGESSQLRIECDTAEPKSNKDTGTNAAMSLGKTKAGDKSAIRVTFLKPSLAGTMAPGATPSEGTPVAAAQTQSGQANVTWIIVAVVFVGAFIVIGLIVLSLKKAR